MDHNAERFLLKLWILSKIKKIFVNFVLGKLALKRRNRFIVFPQKKQYVNA